MPARPRRPRLHSPVLALLPGLALLAACGSDQAPPLGPDLELAPVEAKAPAGLLLAARAYTVDQENTRIDPARGPLAIFASPAAGQTVRQTFTAGRSGLLGFLELPVGCAPGVLLGVRITDATGGRVEYAVNVVVPEVVDGRLSTVQLYAGPGRGGVPVVRGRTYAFELRAFAAVGVPQPLGVSCGIAREVVGNNYARGSLFTWEDVSPTFPDRRWVPRPEEDLPFRTLVR
jgi:hypothetical protein